MMSGEPRSTASAPMREIKVTAAADVWTIVAIAVVAYVFADTIHEAIGFEMPPLSRSRGWMIAVGILGVLFIAVLGPGLKFH